MGKLTLTLIAASVAVRSEAQIIDDLFATLGNDRFAITGDADTPLNSAEAYTIKSGVDDAEVQASDVGLVELKLTKRGTRFLVEVASAAGTEAGNLALASGIGTQTFGSFGEFLTAVADGLVQSAPAFPESCDGIYLDQISKKVYAMQTDFENGSDSASQFGSTTVLAAVRDTGSGAFFE